MEKYRDVCLKAVNGMFPVLFSNISLLKNNEITHMIGNFGGPEQNVKLARLDQYPTSTSGLYVVLIFKDCAMHGYVTFHNSVDFDLDISPPYEKSSKTYDILCNM